MTVITYKGISYKRIVYQGIVYQGTINQGTMNKNAIDKDFPYKYIIYQEALSASFYIVPRLSGVPSGLTYFGPPKDVTAGALPTNFSISTIHVLALGA